MNRNSLLAYFFVLLVGLAVSFFVTEAKFNPNTINIVVFFLVFIPTLINPDIGLIIIIISMLFSPDVILGYTSGREITVRIEDIFLIVVILAWFIRVALTKNIARSLKNRLSVPFFLYLACCVISTVLAYLFGDIDIAKSSFSILKYLEYFLLFLMVKNNIRSIKQIKLFVAVFLLVAFLVSIYSSVFIYQKQTTGVSFFRLSPPVETRAGGESNTMGGYLMFMIAIAAGLLLYSKSLPLRIFLGCLIILLFRGLLFTLSRGSYLAFLPMLFALVYFSKKISVAYISAILLVLVILFMPSMVRERLTGTIIEKQTPEGTYLALEESPALRLESWKDALFVKFPASPIFGHGVGTYFIDGQIFLTLCEVGLLGLTFFFWLLVRLLKMAKHVFTEELIRKDDFGSGITLGFLAGLIGLLGQSISANTFIIIRIMEPFWFIAAIVVMLPEIGISAQPEISNSQ